MQLSGVKTRNKNCFEIVEKRTRKHKAFLLYHEKGREGPFEF